MLYQDDVHVLLAEQRNERMNVFRVSSLRRSKGSCPLSGRSVEVADTGGGVPHGALRPSSDGDVPAGETASSDHRSQLQLYGPTA